MVWAFLRLVVGERFDFPGIFFRLVALAIAGDFLRQTFEHSRPANLRGHESRTETGLGLAPSRPGSMAPGIHTSS